MPDWKCWPSSWWPSVLRILPRGSLPKAHPDDHPADILYFPNFFHLNHDQCLQLPSTRLVRWLVEFRLDFYRFIHQFISCYFLVGVSHHYWGLLSHSDAIWLLQQYLRWVFSPQVKIFKEAFLKLLPLFVRDEFFCPH